MMRPPSWSSITGTTSRVIRKTPRKLTFISSSQSAGDISTKGMRRLKPALLTRMSIGPSVSLVTATARRASASFAGRGHRHRNELVRTVARRESLIEERPQLRPVDGADRERERAPWMQKAATREIDRARDFALQCDGGAYRVWVGEEDRGEER